MKLFMNKGFIALVACITLAVVMTVSGTLADNDYSKNYSDPFTTYNREIDVNDTIALHVDNGYRWVNGNGTVLQLTASTGSEDATVKGLKPGVSTVTVSTSYGSVSIFNYKVVDKTNIKSYSLTGGAEGSIAAKNGTLTIPVTTDPVGSANKISWTSLNANVATVSGGVVTAQADNGAVIILGEFTDPWGLEHTIPFLVIVGEGGGGGGGGIIIGPDGNHYRPVGRPPHVYEKLNNDDTSKVPPEYVYNPDDEPGNGNDIPAVKGEDGKFYIEDPENIFTPIDDNGDLDTDNMIWGGPDGKPGTGDDMPVEKHQDEYWVHMGQNVWRKYSVINPRGPLGPLTGGGPDGDPTTDPVTEIFDNTDKDGKYYVGPLGPDEDGYVYYYGDPMTGGNGTLDSTANGLEKDDVKYYKDENGNMTTTKPAKPITEEPIGTDDGRVLLPAKTGDSANWLEIARNGDYSLIVRTDFINVNSNNKNDAAWQGTLFGSNNVYQGSNVQGKINSWFNGSSTVESLDNNARLRSFTVSNNASSTVGAGCSGQGGLTNGFSKPTTYQTGSGNDVAFVLSFCEMANFISKEYASSPTGGVYENSSALAVSNFGKIKAYDATKFMWLRSPGTSSSTAGTVQHTIGRAFQMFAATDVALIYPALWVHQDIFK